MNSEVEEFFGLNSTVNVCENCILKCSYCYEFKKAQSPSEDIKFWTKVSESKDPVRAALGKEVLDIADYSFANGRDDGTSRVISMDYVEQFYDQLLSSNSPYKNNDIANSGLIIDLIGGDALQYPELVDQILECFTYKVYKYNTKLAQTIRNHWRISISSNGVPLLRDDVRDVLTKWGQQISIGVSIDGCPELHDLNRWIYPDDKRHKIDPIKYPKHIGSWKYIMPSFDFYREHFLTAAIRTKWTVVPSSYKYIMKSVKFLHEELKMTEVFFNRVMEDNVVDTPESVKELVDQFKELLEYALEHEDELSVSALNAYSPRSMLRDDTRSCGFGSMPALSVDGDVFSCFRLLPHGNVDTKPYKQGSINSGILSDKKMLRYLIQSACICNIKFEGNVYSKYNTENNLMLNCNKCPILGRCGACTAGCLLAANPDGRKVPFKRTTSNCWFHKVQSLFSLYYQERAGHKLLSENDLNTRAMLEKDVSNFIKLADRIDDKRII